jgi:hypothetical protein
MDSKFDADEVLFDTAYKISDRFKSGMNASFRERIIFKSDILKELDNVASVQDKKVLDKDQLVAATFQRLMMQRKIGDKFELKGHCVRNGSAIERVVLRVEEV